MYACVAEMSNIGTSKHLADGTLLGYAESRVVFCFGFVLVLFFFVLRVRFDVLIL